MRRGKFIIALFLVLPCLSSQVAAASGTRPIIYSKASWEWVGPEGERHLVTRGGLFATAEGAQRQLTTDPQDSEPSISRDGSTIVFVRGGDLYSVASNGSGQRQLTNGPELDERPQVSPNGRYVLFARRSAQGSPADLYTASLGGGEPKALALGPTEDSEASFSPDGKVIVFVRSLPVNGRVTENDELFSVHPSGFGLTRLTRTPEDELHPHYYARGIVFDRRKTPRGGPAAIYTMRRDGSGIRSVLSSRVGAAVQAVSPDGRLLVFSIRNRGTWKKRLVGPTRRSRRLDRSASGYLVFSPDGRRVAGAFTNTSSEVSPFASLYSIDVTNGRSRYEGETWEAEAPGPVQTSVGPRIAW